MNYSNDDHTVYSTDDEDDKCFSYECEIKIDYFLKINFLFYG